MFGMRFEAVEMMTVCIFHQKSIAKAQKYRLGVSKNCILSLNIFSLENNSCTKNGNFNRFVYKYENHLSIELFLFKISENPKF